MSIGFRKEMERAVPFGRICGLPSHGALGASRVKKSGIWGGESEKSGEHPNPLDSKRGAAPAGWRRRAKGCLEGRCRVGRKEKRRQAAALHTAAHRLDVLAGLKTRSPGLKSGASIRVRGYH